MQFLGVNQIGRFDFEPILAGDFPRVTEDVTLAGGSVYPLGSVLALRGDGKCVLLNSADATTEPAYTPEPYAVLAETVDATSDDTVGVAWLTGEFIRHRLVFGGSDTWGIHKAAARKIGIFFQPARKQPNE